MTEKKKKEDTKIRCGVIMPISAIDNYSENHWNDVRDILFDAIEDAGFEPNMVSDSDDVGIIQKRIIQNVYENPVVVCDVSGKNPNVMFELGLRLAFDKPTIIIKDSVTSYSFDTAPIEHLSYPKDLRFNEIVNFKALLIEKINGTYKKSINDPEYTTFLKHFGKFTVAKIDTKEVPTTEFILEELRNLRDLVKDAKNNNQFVKRSIKRQTVLCLQKATTEEAQAILAKLQDIAPFNIQKKSGLHYHFDSPQREIIDWENILSLAKEIVPSARLFPLK